MAREFRARGEAALIRERGRAVAEALDTVYDAWQQAGPSAMQIQLIENLEGLLTSAGRVAQKVKVKHLTAIDKGDGQSIISVAAAYPELLQSVFDAVEKTTGINIPAEVAGRPAELPDAKTVSNSEGAQS
jgi:flotillin